MTSVFVFADFCERAALESLLAAFEDVRLDVGPYCIGGEMGEDKEGRPRFGPVGRHNVKIFGRDRVCVADTLIAVFGSDRCTVVPCPETDRVVLRVE